MRSIVLWIITSTIFYSISSMYFFTLQYTHNFPSLCPFSTISSHLRWEFNDIFPTSFILIVGVYLSSILLEFIYIAFIYDFGSSIKKLREVEVVKLNLSINLQGILCMEWDQCAKCDHIPTLKMAGLAIVDIARLRYPCLFRIG